MIREWVLYGRASGERVPACRSCGYKLDASHGTCPECGLPFIPTTIHLRAESPPNAWRIAWTVGSIVVVPIGLLLSLEFASPLVHGVVGAGLATIGIVHRRVIDWFVRDALSDIERREPATVAVVGLWSMAALANCLLGGVLCVLAVARLMF